MAPQAAPCVEKARAYRKTQLPHRARPASLRSRARRRHPRILSFLPPGVVDPAVALGHRRCKAGENLDGADLYPLCEGFEALDSFGLGLSLYFRQLGFLFCVVCVCALILLPSSFHNARACDHEETEADYKNAGLSRGTAAGCLAEDLSRGANVVPDLVVCVVILVAALVSNVFQDVLARARGRKRARRRSFDSGSAGRRETRVARRGARSIARRNQRSLGDRRRRSASTRTGRRRATTRSASRTRPTTSWSPTPTTSSSRGTGATTSSP